MLTFEINVDGDEIEVHGDNNGLKALVQILQNVIQSGEHDHLMTPAWGGKELTEEKQSDSSKLVNKVTVHIWP